MEKNIKNLQNEYSNKKVEYDTITNNFEDKKKVLIISNDIYNQPIFEFIYLYRNC